MEKENRNLSPETAYDSNMPQTSAKELLQKMKGETIPLLYEDIYTTDDLNALPEDILAELIDGRIYDMSTPTTVHQRLVMNLSAEIRHYIQEKGGTCEVFPAPFGIFLNQNNKTLVIPDISIICDKSKLDDKGCNGAPDWVIEIISPSTRQKDYGLKLFKYRNAGVREYWIVNPQTRVTNVYDFEHDDLHSDLYPFDECMTSRIFEDFSIQISGLLE